MTYEKTVGAPGWTPGTPQATTEKESKPVSKIPKHPLELEVGDVIAEHPHSNGATNLRVTAPPVRFDDKVEIEIAGRGTRGYLVVAQHDTVTVRTTHRQDVLGGFRELLDLMDATPYLPVERWPVVQYTASQGRLPADAVREVDRVAALLGVQARWRGADYVAEREFGPVRYVVTAQDAKEATS